MKNYNNNNYPIKRNNLNKFVEELIVILVSSIIQVFE